jgi:hypothetical protein
MPTKLWLLRRMWTMRWPADSPTDRRLHVLGIPIDGATFDSLLKLIAEWITAGDRLHQICTVSPEFVMIAQDEFCGLPICASRTEWACCSRRATSVIPCLSA